VDGISNANRAGADHLGEHTLAAVHHQSAQALADGIHLGAWVARGMKEQHGTADFDFAAQKRDEVDARSLNVGTDRARGDGWQTEGRGMFGDLLPLD